MSCIHIEFFPCLTLGTNSAVSRGFKTRGRIDFPSGQSRFKLSGTAEVPGLSSTVWTLLWLQPNGVATLDKFL